MIRFNYFDDLTLKDGIMNYILNEDMFWVSNSVSYEICVDLENGDFVMDIKDIGDFPEHSSGYICCIDTCGIMDDYCCYEYNERTRKKACNLIFREVRKKLEEYKSKYYITKTEAIKRYGKKIIDNGWGFVKQNEFDNPNNRKWHLYDTVVIEYYIRKSKNLISYCFLCRQYYDPDKHNGYNFDISVKYEYKKDRGYGSGNYGFNTLTNICPDCLDKVLKSMNINWVKR